jgi:glycerol-1-phosphate dehydrogenase [NAD(P)+]
MRDKKYDTHRMDLPKTIIIGKEILKRLTEVYNELENQDNMLIFTGPNVYRLIRNKIDKRINISDKNTFFVYEATWNEIKRLEEIVQRIDDKENYKYILGIGGGKVIDITKMIAYKFNKNFISLPTSPSHDGIASQFVSIRGGKRAYSYVTKPPTAVIVDMSIIYSAPHRYIASGVGDAIAKITAVKDWELAREKVGEYYGEYSASLALLGAELVKRNSLNIGKREQESIRTLVEALISDGVAAGIAGSSRPCSGSEHLFSHALDLYGERHALHGEQVGVGTILMAYLHGIDYGEIIETLTNVGAPTTYKELNVKREDVINAIVKAKSIRPERYTILNEYKVDRDFAERLAKKTGVI